MRKQIPSVIVLVLVLLSFLSSLSIWDYIRFNPYCQVLFYLIFLAFFLLSCVYDSCQKNRRPKLIFRAPKIITRNSILAVQNISSIFYHYATAFTFQLPVACLQYPASKSQYINRSVHFYL